MAQSLLRKGLAVSGADLNAEAVEKLRSAGGEGFGSAREAAEGADILITVVVNAAQTEAVLYGEAGAAAVMKKGGVIISSATMSPDDARRLARQGGLAEQGAEGRHAQAEAPLAEELPPVDGSVEVEDVVHGRLRGKGPRPG